MFQTGGLPTAFGNCEQYIFTGNSFTQNVGWFPWKKPANKGMAHIILIGAGAGGGTGKIGAVSNSAGGGGGGSGAQTIIMLPLIALPEVLFLNLATGRSSGDADGVNNSYICNEPSNARVNSVLAYAVGGGLGGSGASSAAALGGGGGGASSAGFMSLGAPYIVSLTAGQNGGNSGGTGNAPNVTMPTTGLLVAGGTGGGGLPATATNGTNGGNYIVPATPSAYPQVVQATGPTSSTTPPLQGGNGFEASPVGLLFYPGMGGASTHGSATGAGAVQASGGAGGFGCGGGGGGGALTGSTAAVGSRGGDAICIITCW